MNAPRSRGPIDHAAAARAIDEFLRAIGLDPKLEPELNGTGARVADAFADELCAGYGEDVDELVRENSIPGRAGVVLVRGIDIATMCPHHLLPAIGTADVAFQPTSTLVGIGTIAAIVQALSRRLVLQEALGEEIADALYRNLKPAWVACRLELAHACMIVRGERQHRARIETVAVRGEISVGEAFQVFGAGAGSGSGSGGDGT
jgi:GTP cyclohydrolase I